MAQCEGNVVYGSGASGGAGEGVENFSHFGSRLDFCATSEGIFLPSAPKAGYGIPIIFFSLGTVG